VPPEKKLRVSVRADSGQSALIAANGGLVCLLAGLGEVSCRTETTEGAVAVAGTGFEAFVFIAEAVDMAQLRAKWAKALDKDRKFIAALKAKLANPGFVQNAPPELLASEKGKLAEAESRAAKIENYLKQE
jgi:valyl-tRNA synthetase